MLLKHRTERIEYIKYSTSPNFERWSGKEGYMWGRIMVMEVDR
jgi:hypothetical protein